MHWCDQNPVIITWGSENITIPYVSPIDGKVHRYYPDFMLRVSENGTDRIIIVEIKPESQVAPPISKRRTRGTLEAQKTYLVNQAKWKAAQIWAEEKNFEFRVLTEKHLGIKG